MKSSFDDFDKLEEDDEAQILPPKSIYDSLR